MGFTTAAALVNELLEARDERRLLNLQRQLARLKLLIIDELGFVPLSHTGAELLFEVFSQRYERGSILVTTNLPFDEWTEVFGSERLTGALLDRLTHHVHILEMNGDSYRLRGSLQSVAAMPAADPAGHGLAPRRCQHRAAVRAGWAPPYHPNYGRHAPPQWYGIPLPKLSTSRFFRWASGDDDVRSEIVDPSHAEPLGDPQWFSGSVGWLSARTSVFGPTDSKL